MASSKDKTGNTIASHPGTSIISSMCVGNSKTNVVVNKTKVKDAQR